MSLTWYAPSEQLPSDGQQVYARILDWYGEPVQAAYSASNQEFTTILTNVTMPVYQVARWAASDPYPGYPFLQSLFPSTGPMYSVFQLRAVQEQCMIIRRSSDNEIATITFTGGLIDVDQIENFLGTDNGFVVKWFDQSGNGFDLFYYTNAQQPQIASAGTVHTVNSVPAIYYDGSDLRLYSPWFTQPQPIRCYAVASLDGSFSTSTAYYLSNGSAGTNGVRIQAGASGYWEMRNGGLLATATVPDSSQHLFNCLFNSSSSSFRLDGASIATGNAGPNGFTSPINIGGGSFTNPWYGYVQEFNIYLSTQSSYNTLIEGNINDRFSIY